MQKKRVVLSFPPQLIDQAVTYRLIKDFDLMINIMRARITPKEQGRLVVEITGKKPALDAGISYLKEVGVEIQPLAQDVRWHEERCVHCTPASRLSAEGPGTGQGQDGSIVQEGQMHCL